MKFDVEWFCDEYKFNSTRNSSAMSPSIDQPGGEPFLENLHIDTKFSMSDLEGL